MGTEYDDEILDDDDRHTEAKGNYGGPNPRANTQFANTLSGDSPHYRRPGGRERRIAAGSRRRKAGALYGSLPTAER